MNEPNIGRLILANNEGLGWPNQAVAKELIDRVQSCTWYYEWDAQATAEQMGELLRLALDRIEELEPDATEPAAGPQQASETFSDQEE